MRTHWKTSAAIAAIVCACGGATAAARIENGVSDVNEPRSGPTIIVTDQQREEIVLNIPIAVWAFSTDSLATYGVPEVSKLWGSPTNVTMSGRMQGTVLGRSTFGGVVNIVTRAPGDEFRLRDHPTTDSFDRGQLRALAYLPDRVALV